VGALPSSVIGVLAIQGAFREHVRMLVGLGARTRLVRAESDLAGLQGLVLPGGESTTMQIVMERVGLFTPVMELVRSGLPTLGTCAGMILLASHISDGRPGQSGFGALGISVRRNGYGRQLASFEAPLEIVGVAGPSFPGIFIRSPVIEAWGSAEVLSSHDGHPVAVREGDILAMAFHPELSSDDRVHRHFLSMVSG